MYHRCKPYPSRKAGIRLLALLALLIASPPIFCQAPGSLLLQFEKQLKKEIAAKNILPRDTAEYAGGKRKQFIRSFHAIKDTALIRQPAPRGPGEPCNNVDFEAGDVTGWEGFTGDNFNSSAPMTNVVSGFAANRHTIVTGGGNDPIVGADIPLVAPGGTYSLRLGNSNNGAQAERIRQTFRVTNQSTTFIYQYAVVLQDPQHMPSQQPYFEIRVLDNAGNLLPCGYYRVVAGAGIPGFRQMTYDGDFLMYKEWETVGIDLSPYVGQDITIEFTTADCTLSGHFGYAYIDGSCDQIYRLFGGGICPEDSFVTLVAPPGFVAYQWSTGDTTSTIRINNGKDGDTVSVILTPVQGSSCNTSVSTVLRIKNEPVAGFGSNTLVCPFDSIICVDSSIVLEDSIVKWQWDFGDGSAFSTKKNPYHLYPSGGDYNIRLVATSGGGCDDTIFKQVKIYSAPNTDFRAEDACIDSIVRFIDNTTDIDGSIVSWRWDLGDLSSAGDTATAKDTGYLYPSAGTYDVTLITLSSNGCADTLITPVTVYPLPIANAGSDTAICYRDSAMLNASGGVSYLWSPGSDMNDSAIANPLAKPLTNTQYKVIVTDTTGCQGTDSVILSIIPLPLVNVFSDTTICYGDTATLGSSGGIAYLWTPGSTLSDSTLPNPVAFPPDTTRYTVTVTDTNACKNTGSVTVYILPLPAIDTITSFSEICQGDSVQINGSVQNGSAFWTHNGKGTIINSSNDTITYFSGTDDSGTVNFFVTISSPIAACGTASDTAAVLIHTLPVVTISSSRDTICENTGDTIHLKSTGALSYVWRQITATDTATLSYTADSILRTPNEPTKYIVIITDTNGCISFAEKDITVLPRPLPGLLTSRSYDCYPATISYQYTLPYSTPIDSVIWDFTNGAQIKNQNPVSYLYEESKEATYPATYHAIVSLYYQNGCKANDTAAVSLCESFYLPNVFTPDGDGKNDFFEIKGLDQLTCSFVVYNRWGEKIYQQEDYQNNWEGTDFSGNRLNTDTYFYLLGCHEKKYTGWVKIIR